MENKINKTFNWLIFSQSYLYLARIGCQELLDPKPHSKTNSIPIKYSAGDIIIPIIYNIKHGIEIFIKTLEIILLDKGNFGHNTHELFGILKREIDHNKAKIEKIIKDECKQNPKSVNLKLAEKDMNDMSMLLSNIDQLISKYHHCDILKSKINNNFVVEDIDNSAFRYPDNNLKIKINYGSVLSNISEEDIKEILIDIDELTDNFNRLGFLLDVYRIYSKK